MAERRREESPRKLKIRKPVTWLLGRKLLISLKSVLVYAAFGKRADPKPWMRPEEITVPGPDRGSEAWFDYVSDTGDGTKATYSIACLTLSDLVLAGAEVGSTARLALDGRPGGERLPRGSFLFIGGDSGPLHIAATTRVPIVELLGPTLAERSFPWRDTRWFTEIVEPGPLPCRPCHQRTCIPGDFRCLTGTGPERVIGAAERALNSRPDSGQHDGSGRNERRIPVVHR